MKGKVEKERYTHLNAEFQRLARRDKKAFLSEQCKEIEENNRMGKTRDLFKKTRCAKGARVSNGVSALGATLGTKQQVSTQMPTLSHPTENRRERKPPRFLL